MKFTDGFSVPVYAECSFELDQYSLEFVLYWCAGLVFLRAGTVLLRIG